MASVDDIVARNPDNVMGGSGSKAEQNVDTVSDVKNDEDDPFADGVVVTNQVVVVENGTVVETTFDINSGLVDRNKVENGIFCSVLDKNDDVVGCGDNVKNDGTVSCAYNGDSGKICSEEVNVGANGKKQGNINFEKIEDLDNVFRVGDFVWGKIKSHPWWPGQIYDSNYASGFAVKHSQEGRLLVAYFGDGSCSWCLPSQLVPFVENFKQMSTDSSSKSFRNAIQSAVDDIGRLVEYNMACKCVRLHRKDGLARPVVSNAGIRKGVLAPDVDIRRLSVPEYDPNELREKLMNHAKAVNVDCLLELAVLRSWLSAFYRAKNGYRLPDYCDPVYIEGLEDKSKTVGAVADDFSVPIEVPILGPRENPSPAVKSQASSDDKIYHRRKQKSVAELMGENRTVKPRNKKRGKDKEEDDVGQSASARKRRKIDYEQIEGSLKGETSRKRNVHVSEMGSNAGLFTGSTKEIEDAFDENASGDRSVELELINTPRERKKSKYLSPPYTDPIWGMGNSGAKMKSKSDISRSNRAELPINMEENDKKSTFSESDVNVQVNELLSDVQFAAVDPLYLSKQGSLDTVWAFVSALRSLTYLDGPDYKLYRKSETDGKKIKSSKNQENESALEKPKSDDDMKPPVEVNTEGKKAVKSKFKKSSEFYRAKNSVEKREGSPSTCLIITFAPESPLPSKEEIVKLFGKYGSLNEQETNVLTESRSVQVVYVKESNAEAAFKSSVSESPFGVENVNYWLRHCSDRSKPQPEISSRAFGNLCSFQPTDDFMTDIRVIRHKLEITNAILENYHSKFSSEEKSSLKDEMKRLMDNVETVSEKVRVMAEKTSS